MYYSYTSSSGRKEQQFSKNEFPLGYIVVGADGFSRPVWDDFMIEDLDDTVRIVIIAKTGSGKTYIIRRIFDMFNQRGIHCAFVNDLKGDMVSSKQPNYDMYKQLKYELLRTSPKLREVLQDISVEKLQEMGFTPTAVEDLVICSPEFAYVPGSLPFSLAFSSLSEPLARTILKIQPNAYKQHRVLDIMLQISKRFAKRGERKLTKEVIEQLKIAIPAYIEKIGSLEKKEKILTREEVVNIFDRLMYCVQKRILDGKYALALEELVVENNKMKNVVFDWSGVKWEELRTISSEYQTYVAAIIYQIIELKRRGKIKNPICIVGDEFQHFLGRMSKSPVKYALEDIFTKGRAYDINSIIAMQFSQGLDRQFFQNADYVLMGSISDEKELAAVRQMFRWIFENDKEESKKAIRVLQGLKKHEFLAIDKNSVDWAVIKSYPPLSMHRGKLV